MNLISTEYDGGKAKENMFAFSYFTGFSSGIVVSSQNSRYEYGLKR